jgi:hypothetical protein
MYRSIDTKWIATADRIQFYAAANKWVVVHPILSSNSNTWAISPQNYAFLALANYVAKKKGFYP